MNKKHQGFTVPSHYFSYNHVDSIYQIAKPLFTQSPITYFDYSRLFFDGGWTFFTSERGVSDFLFDAGFAFLPYIKIDKKRTFTLLSTVPTFAPYLVKIKQNFNVDNLFAYIIKEDKHLDIYWFGSNSNNHTAIDFYFNNLDILQRYTQYFHNQAADLVTMADNNRIIIPSSLRGSYSRAFEKAKLIETKNSILKDFFADYIINAEKIKFTNRELDCIRYFVNGYTAKMIAHELSLSPRTIEQYMERIKTKLNCRSKKELIYFLQKC